MGMAELQLEVNWRRLEQIKDEDVTVIATVTGSNKGGLLVSVEHMTAFIPASHLPHGVSREWLEQLLAEIGMIPG